MLCWLIGIKGNTNCYTKEIEIQSSEFGTKQKFRCKVWWPGMEKDADTFCKACYGCQLVSRPDNVEPIRTTVLPTGPWRDLAVDLLRPLPTSESLLVVDYYSRYYEIEVMKSTTTSKVIERLDEIFSRHNPPESLTSDNLFPQNLKCIWIIKEFSTIKSQRNCLKKIER